MKHHLIFSFLLVSLFSGVYVAFQPVHTDAKALSYHKSYILYTDDVDALDLQLCRQDPLCNDVLPISDLPRRSDATVTTKWADQ